MDMSMGLTEGAGFQGVRYSDGHSAADRVLVAKDQCVFCGD